AEDGIRDATVTGVQTCALPISGRSAGLLQHRCVVLPRARLINRVAIIGVISPEFGKRDALYPYTRMSRKWSLRERLGDEVILRCNRAMVKHWAVGEIDTWRHVQCGTGGRP